MEKKKKQKANVRGTLEAWILLADIIKLSINRTHELLVYINKTFMRSIRKEKKKS